MRLFRILTISCGLLWAGTVHAGLKQPSCEAIAAWATASDALTQKEITAGYKIPSLATDERIVPLFGLPLQQWQPADQRQVRNLIGKCRKAAARARNRDLAAKLSKAQSSLNRASAIYMRLLRDKERQQRRALQQRQQAKRYSDQYRQRVEKVIASLGDLPPNAERDLAYNDAISILEGRQPPARNWRNRYISSLLYNLQGQVPQLSEEDKAQIHDRLLQTKAEKSAETAQRLASARAELKAALQELQSLQLDQAGYARINELMSLPALKILTPSEVAAFRMQVQARKNQLVAAQRQQQQQRQQAALAEARNVIDSYAINKLGDLGRYVKAYTVALGKLRSDPGYYQYANSLRQRFLNRFIQERDRLLPEFASVIEKVPNDEQGMRRLSNIAFEVTGIDRRNQKLIQPYFLAAQKRAEQIKAERQYQACLEYLKRNGVEKDHIEDLLWAGEQTTLGRFICAAGSKGFRLTGYKGPGMFSSSRELQMKSPNGPVLLIKLQPDEIEGQSKEMLIGYEVAQGKDEKALELEQWEMIANNMTGMGRDRICQRLMQIPKNEMTVEQTQAAIGCVMGDAFKRMQ